MKAKCLVSLLDSGSPDINTRLPLCCGKGILNFLVGRSSHTLTTPFSYWHRLTLHKPSSSSSSWCISKFEPVHDKTGPAPAMFLPGTPGERFFVATWLNFLDAKFWTRFIPFQYQAENSAFHERAWGRAMTLPFEIRFQPESLVRRPCWGPRASKREAPNLVIGINTMRPQTVVSLHLSIQHPFSNFHCLFAASTRALLMRLGLRWRPVQSLVDAPWCSLMQMMIRMIIV